MERAGTPRPRRRGDALLAAIHGAVIEELSASGYGGLTMEAVAARAGTGKQPLYRRWPDKDAMILDTVRHGLPTGAASGYSGDVRADLIGLLHQLAGALASPVGGAMRALLGETYRRPELLAALEKSLFEPQGADLRAVLREAAARGELDPALADGHLSGIGHETLMFRFLTVGLPADPAALDARITEIVDDVVLPLLRGR